MGITISGAQWLNLLINLFLPALTAWVTARNASAQLKAVVLLILSALSGFLVSWLDALNNALIFDWSQAGFTALTGFLFAVAVHFGLLKPIGLTGSDGHIQLRLPGGLGDSSAPAPKPGRHEAPEAP
jgi:hypothetical protein